MTDQQFLAGDTNGKAVTVTGEFRIAQGQGRLPVVVLVHGSGGMGPNIEAWAREINAMGVSTFALDGFTGRGLTSVNMDQARSDGSPSRSMPIAFSTFSRNIRASIRAASR